MKSTNKKQDQNRRESQVGEINLLPGSSSRVGTKSSGMDFNMPTDGQKRAVSKRSSFQQFTFD